MISTKEQLEKEAIHFGILPFFRNNIKGFSVEEMAAPGKLFGLDRGDDGCWEWKGPVIRQQTLAYGKFFRKKAGFVSLELLTHFLNYRRAKYPVSSGMDDDILSFIKEQEGLTSTELKKIIFGTPKSKRQPSDLLDVSGYQKPKRHSLEGSLQRLQMGGHLLIADFEYKYTSAGMRYGWGVALYSTPEIWFERDFGHIKNSPEESLKILIDNISERIPKVHHSEILKILT